MKIFDGNNEQRKPLLSDEKIQIVEHNGMGSEKWHTLLRSVGPHLAGQGGRRGLSRDIYNFSKSGLRQPLTANEGILLGLIPKKTNQGPERQTMNEERLSYS